MNYILYEYFKSRIDLAPNFTVERTFKTTTSNNKAAIVIPEEVVNYGKRQSCEMYLRLPKNRTDTQLMDTFIKVLNTINYGTFLFKDVYITFSYDTVAFNTYDDNGNFIYLITYNIVLKKGGIYGNTK